MNAYFANGVRRLVDHQIESFEDFVRNKIPLIIQSTPPITVWHEQNPDIKKYKYEFKLSFENISYMKPKIQEATGRIKPMLPMEARVRNFTYAANMYANVRFIARTYKGEKYESYDEESRVFEGISLGKLPVMLGSSLCLLKDYPLSQEQLGECAHDPLGYFIIHGSERTILCQEKVADNRIMVFQAKKTNSKYTYSVEMKSLHESFTMPPKKLEIRLSSKFNGLGYPLLACVPRFHEDIPVMVYFRALGVETDEAIAQLVWGTSDNPHVEALAASFRDCAELGIFTQEDAVRYLAQHLQYGTTQEDKSAYVRQLLSTEYLPHVRFAGENVDIHVWNARKALVTASMVRRLVLTDAGQIPLDDRDSYPNKRVVTTGALLTHLFRQLFQKVCNDTRNEFVQEINNDAWKKGDTPRPLHVLNSNNLYKILKLTAIESKMKQALATGNFTVQGLGTSSSTSLSNATKVGVSQVLARMSYNSTISHLRRVQTPVVEKTGKLLPPRKLHGTSWGFVCPVETPEGHSVGIVKNMSLLASVTQHIPSNTVLHFLQGRSDITWIDRAQVYSGCAITLNGVIIGYTDTPQAVVADLRNAKHSFRLHPQLSIAWYTLLNTILIETDGGRLIRPVFRVGAPTPIGKCSWNEWVTSCVEYIDASETETLRIATDKESVTPHHTHYEIHPSLVLGHMASSIPLSDHNQSPRNTYQSAMGKQSMCVYAGNYMNRLDKNGYLLCSLTRPLVETRIQNILKAHEMPCGFNAIVAIACYGGYNQEDSIIMNKTSVARGFMRGLYSTMYKDEEHRNVTSGREEKFMKPSKHNTRKYKNTSYDAIGENGLPRINAYVKENDVVIGKCVNLKNDPNGYAYRDASTTHKNAEPARIDGVWQDKNSDGYPFLKVRCVSERVPQIGDKFCLTDDHEVLTKNRGWVGIADVRLEDEVAQLNRETGLMEYVNPLETMVFDHEGDMYEVETQGVSLKTTLNHRMWVQREGRSKFELVEAREIVGEDVIYQTDVCVWKVEGSKGKIVPGFRGKVYCIRVPSEVFLVRRKGVCTFTGNSSRHGQKGTVGMLLDEEDMPFTASGLRPDLIMNPHAVPSRMTIAQLMENMFGKIAVRKGTICDGTPYSHLKVDELKKQMIELGMHPYGNEILYNGMTGEQMVVEIFMGPTFYQRLKHMVIDKTHSRSKGPVVSLTRQPCEGRSREGGLRVGEMERDCMLSHGASAFTKERLMDVSDPFPTGICKTCGTFANVNEAEGIYQCGTCNGKSEFLVKTIPFAMKLWSQELEAMHITTRLTLA